MKRILLIGAFFMFVGCGEKPSYLTVPIVDTMHIYNSIEYAFEHTDGVIPFSTISGDRNWDVVCLIAPYSTPQKDVGLYVNDKTYFNDKFFDDVDEDSWGLGFVFIKDHKPIKYARIKPSPLTPSLGENLYLASKNIGNDGRYLSRLRWSNQDKGSFFKANVQKLNICFSEEYTLKITSDWTFKVIKKEIE